MRFYVIDQLHRPGLWEAPLSVPAGKVTCKEPQNYGIFGNASTHSRHHMNHMRIILDLAQELDLYLTSPAAQIITCQVDQHDMVRAFSFSSSNNLRANSESRISSPVRRKVPAIGSI